MWIKRTKNLRASRRFYFCFFPQGHRRSFSLPENPKFFPVLSRDLEVLLQAEANESLSIIKYNLKMNDINIPSAYIVASFERSFMFAKFVVTLMSFLSTNTPQSPNLKPVVRMQPYSGNSFSRPSHPESHPTAARPSLD